MFIHNVYIFKSGIAKFKEKYKRRRYVWMYLKVHTIKVQKVTEYRSCWCVHTAWVRKRSTERKKIHWSSKFRKEIKTNVARGEFASCDWDPCSLNHNDIAPSPFCTVRRETSEGERRGRVVHSSGLINLSSFCSCWLCSIRGKYQHSPLRVSSRLSFLPLESCCYIWNAHVLCCLVL